MTKIVISILIRGRDRMVVGFTTTWVVNVDVDNSNPDHGEVYSIQHKESLSVACGRSVVLLGTLVSPTNKTDRHDITEILLKVV